MELGAVTDYSHAQEPGACKRWVCACPPWNDLKKKYAMIKAMEESKARGLVFDEESSDE